MKRLLVYLAMLMSIGGVVWGGICTYYGLHTASLIPYGYVLVSFANLLLFHLKKDYRASRFIQVLVSLLLPFMFQWSLGGFVSSGAVMLWANLALVGSLALHRGNNAYWWLGFYAILTLVSLAIDGYVHDLRPAVLLDENAPPLTALNTIMVSSITFIIAKILLDYGRKARKEANAKNLELTQQKQIIEQKNTDITASLSYASHIQKGILGSAEEILSHFTDGFLLYKPKDIVSGDFYWYREVNHKKLLAIADCTGHGVPGAFMTILGHNLLDQVTIGQGETSPAKILSQLNTKLIAAIRTGFEDERVDDGIDLLVLTVDDATQTLTLAAAKTVMWYFQEGSLHEIRGERFSLGSMGKKKEKIFQEHTINYAPTDTFYVFSDGFHDQMGGANRKRFLRQNFAFLIEKIHNHPFAKQKELLLQELASWQGDNPQTDDIVVLGFKP